MGLTGGITSLGVAYRIMVNLRDVTEAWKRERRLIEISVEDREGSASDSCELVLDDRPPHIAWPPEGASVRLWLGNSVADLTDLGLFTLDAPTASCPPHRLNVRGHAASFVAGSGSSLPMHTERSRLWQVATLGTMVTTIARDHGLLPRIQPALAAELVGNVEQIGESDLAFLERIVKQYGARVRVKGSSTSPKGALEVVGAGSQLPQVVLTPTDVERWSAPLGARFKPGSVTAYWHNPKTGLSGVRTVGSGEPRVVITDPYETAAQAKSAAKSKLEDGERESAQLSLDLTTLNVSIASGAEIALSGFRSEIDTVWNVVQVRHRASASSARTSIVAEKSV